MAEKKGAGGKPQRYDENTGEYASMPTAKRLVRQYESRFGAVERYKLSKSEWRRYYGVLGEIRAGTFYAPLSKNGDRWVVLSVNIESDGTITSARLILDNGSYVSPTIKAILTFDTDDDLYDFISD